jgi:hypothetical protein
MSRYSIELILDSSHSDVKSVVYKQNLSALMVSEENNTYAEFKET